MLLLFQFVLTKIFQKWTVFVFTESWSRDQLLGTTQIILTAHPSLPSWPVLIHAILKGSNLILS